jgi:hypothetical protein
MQSPISHSAVRARVAVLVAVATVVGAALVPSAAASAQVPSTTASVAAPAPAPTPPHHPLAMGSYKASTYAAAGAQLPTGLKTALSRDLGVTGAEYLADAAAAAQAVKVVASLKSAGVHVLGSKIKGTALTVNVASADDKATVTAAGATPVVGAPAATDLSGTTFHTVAAPAPTPLAYGGQGYFFQTNEQISEGLGNGYRCSIGFSGYSASLAAQFVSAGHCAVDIETNPALLVTQNLPTNYGGRYTVTDTPLGLPVSTEAQFGGNRDYGIINEGTAVLPQANIYTWGSGAGAPLASAPLPITGQTAAVNGANLCKSGSTSGWTCGTVVAVDDPTPVCQDGEAEPCAAIVNAIIATTCLLPGDSGGGAVIGQLAAGIDSGSDFPDTSCANSYSSSSGWAHYSEFFPMVSAAGSDSVTGQVGSNWKLLAAPLVTAPAAGATVLASTSLTGTLFNPQASATVALYLDGSTTAYSTKSAASGSFSIPLSSVAGGAHSYSLVETVGGNQVAVVPGTFTIPVPAVPVVTALPACTPVTLNTVLTGTLASPVPSSTVSLTFDGASTPFKTVSASGGTWSIPLTGLANGNHEYTITSSTGGSTVSAAASGVLTMTDTSTSSSALDQQEAPVYRFYSPLYNDHFYTMNASECAGILSHYPTSVWSYEGVAYNAFSSQQAGTVALYRFWSPVYKGHFLTADASESASVQAKYPTIWSFEGVDFYVYPEDLTTVSSPPAASDTVEVARFWSAAYGQHFYSVDPIEIAYLKTHYPSNIWNYEGFNFRVPKS